jgi:antitoxin YefM
MTSLSAAQARTQLYPLLQKVAEDHEVIEISSRHGSAVLVDADDYRSLAETEYVLRSPANAQALRRSLDQLEHGRTVTIDLEV